MVRHGWAVGVLLLALPGPAGSAAAAQAGATMAIKVEVLAPPCAVSDAALDYGTYTSGQLAPLDGSAEVSFAGCGPGVVTLELDGGQSGDQDARHLGNSGASLGYGLFQDAARTRTFGTGSSAASLTLADQSAGHFTVYGRIPAHQTAAAGAFTDTVNMTLAF
jgi:spore coat protein U-like protein